MVEPVKEAEVLEGMPLTVEGPEVAVDSTAAGFEFGICQVFEHEGMRGSGLTNIGFGGDIIEGIGSLCRSNKHSVSSWYVEEKFIY